ARPRERRVTVAAIELGFGHCRERPYVRRGNIRARLESGIARLGCEAHVPRTDVLADVAAKQPIAYLGALCAGERAAMLDREVRDTGARIEIARSHERLRGARLEATRARAAAIGFEGQVRGQLRIGQDDTDRSEEHTSELQSRFDLVCRLLLEKKKNKKKKNKKTNKHKTH